VVWRWQDGDHYYVARANALENNVSLYYTEGGGRKTLTTPTHRWRQAMACAASEFRVRGFGYCSTAPPTSRSRTTTSAARVRSASGPRRQA